jgi:hypothetical protein
MLPFDYSRCKPDLPDAFCRNCKRWADHPNQTWGERTPCNYGVENSTDFECRFIKVEDEDVQK